MNIFITPGRLSGVFTSPPSKSQLLRALVCACLCENETVIRFSGELPQDALVMISALTSLGAKISVSAGTVTVHPAKELVHSAVLDCRESGCTLRFLSPVAAALGVSFTLNGTGRLPSRPLCSLPELLSAHGCTLSGSALPFSCSGSLCPGEYITSGAQSSQHISGLLLALPLLSGDSRIIISPAAKPAGYPEMTVSMLARFAINVERTEDGYRVRGGQKYISPGEITIEGDWSGASFFLVAGAVAGDVTCRGLELNSRQPDRELLRRAVQLGVCVKAGTHGWSVRQSAVPPFSADISATPDLAPALAVLMCAANGHCSLTGGASLRGKESDRLEALQASLNAIGASVTQSGDSLEIDGTGTLNGGVSDSFGDHRIAMALTVASVLCKKPLILKNAGCVEKSYPGFYKDFIGIGGRIDVL